MTTDPQALHVVRQAGTGPQVVVVHGAMDRSVSFGRMARFLPDRELVRYDRRGYARSHGLGAADLEAHVADLVHLASGRPTVAVGHSVGGVIALAAASRTADLVGVLVYEAPAPWSPWWPATDRGDGGSDAAEEAEAFMRRMIGEELWRRLPRSIRAARRSEGAALRADLAAVERTDPPYDLRAIEVPICVVAGSATTWYHRRASEELASAVGTDLVVIEGAGHGAHLTHPAELAEVVGRFVDLTT